MSIEQTWETAVRAEPRLRVAEQTARKLRPLYDDDMIGVGLAWYGILKPMAAGLVGYDRGVPAQADDPNPDRSQDRLWLTAADLSGPFPEKEPPRTETERGCGHRPLST